MNYIKIYESIIQRSKVRVIVEGYKEVHHIIPRCIGGLDSTDNLVALTPEEHFVCHQLLTKIHPTNKGLAQAAFIMGLNSNRQRPNSKLYGWLRKRHSEAKRYKRINKNCQVCGAMFNVLEGSKYNNKKYCSRNCAVESKKKRITKQCKVCNNNFEAMLYYSEQQYCGPKCANAGRVKKRATKSCLRCQKTFTVPVSLSKKKYCSKKCMHPIRITKTCLKCTKEFTVTAATNFRIYCSKKCCNNKIITKVCLRCKQHFTIPERYQTQKFCSIKCKNDVRSTKNCLCCNKSFTVLPSYINKKFCSNTCKYKKIISQE
jgi:hypothetical protein